MPPTALTRSLCTGTILLLVSTFPAIATNARKIQLPDSWQSEMLADHPLAGQIWDVKAANLIPPDALGKAAAGSDFLLLGEKHDNPDHHRIQAWLVQEALSDGSKRPVAWEMIDTGQSAALKTFLNSDSPTAEALGRAIGWEDSGWPDWSMYRPIAEAALTADAPVVAASLPRASFRPMFSNGAEKELGRERYQGLGLNRPLPPAASEILAAEIRTGHCGAMPEAMVAPMAEIQTVKDAQMAWVMTHNDDGSPQAAAILIAGNGHVRTDIGVPVHLARRIEANRIMTVGLLEVSRDMESPEDYRTYFHDRELPFDYVWFTPRVDRIDPCEKYSKQLKKIGEDKE